MKLCTKYTIMERHTFTINFSASPSKCRKNGLMPIYATITQNGERATFTTGKYIHPNSDSAQAINNHLLQLRNKIYKKELEMSRSGFRKGWWRQNSRSLTLRRISLSIRVDLEILGGGKFIDKTLARFVNKP